MHNILVMLSSEIVFWVTWIIIPFFMEIVPALFGFAILVKKRIMNDRDPKLTFYPHISLIIPIYNSAGSLAQCLDSVLASNYPKDKLDILLVNNGSRDSSFEIFQKYQNLHVFLNLKWINAKQGKSKALNMALYNCKGKYIVHIDSDGILHAEALTNLIRRFEAHENVHCMTGVILTNPQMIEETKGVFTRLMQKTEFFEYAQAFLAGRNYEAELNSIFTLSGAFSAFRKSTILKTQLYNTETVCEDTHVTFQVRRILKKKIDICENAIFFVDPIESVQKLYVQRQRWQRGELEVAHMFPRDEDKASSRLMEKLLLYDHTFAFPRMIWYFALICLTFMDYPFSIIIISTVLISMLYIISAFLYYINICSYLYWEKNLQKYYARKLLIVFILPLFNSMVFWFRLAGIINSIKGTSSWSTKSLEEEIRTIKKIVSSDLLFVLKYINKIKVKIYNNNK